MTQQTTQPAQAQQSDPHYVLVGSAALQLVRNALRNDVDRGLTVRGEILAELDKATSDATAQAAQGEPVVPPELDVRRILLDIVPGDGDGFEVYAKTIDDVVAKIETLPRMLTVEGRNKVHVVHAELNVGLIDHQITDADIEDPDILRKMLTLSSLDGDFSFWGRAVFGEFYGHPMPSYDMLNQKGIDRLAKFSHPNLSLIISGHTIMDKPLCFGNLLNIDTGAYKGSLSGYCIQTNTVFTLNKDASDFVYEVNEINLND